MAIVHDSNEMVTLVNKDLYINEPKISYAGEETE